MTPFSHWEYWEPRLLGVAMPCTSPLKGLWLEPTLWRTVLRGTTGYSLVLRAGEHKHTDAITGTQTACCRRPPPNNNIINMSLDRPQQRGAPLWGNPPPHSLKNASVYVTPINPRDPSGDRFATFAALISGIASVETLTWFLK